MKAHSANRFSAFESTAIRTGKPPYTPWNPPSIGVWLWMKAFGI